jgi:hypothetical protein
MVIYFVEILENLFKAQYTYIDFYKLIIREDKSFLDFYTYFLYLISIGKIPMDNLQLDLYNKFTLAL